MRTVGVLPAAGTASRLGPLACSKEVLPLVASGAAAAAGAASACERVLAGMGTSGVDRAVVVLRAGKGDVAAYLGRASGGVELAYRFVATSASVPETVAAALPFAAECRVALAFPDLLYHPPDALRTLLAAHEASGADVVLGLFASDRPDKGDVVVCEADGRVREIRVKRAGATGPAWGMAVWSPAASKLLSRLVEAGTGEPAGEGELQLSAIFLAALAEGLRVQAVDVPHGAFLDLGTPEDLARAASWLLARAVSGVGGGTSSGHAS